jgi:hypothetical protein
MTIAQNHPQPLLIDLSNTDLQLSPEQFERLRMSNPDLHLELTKDGKLAVMPPTSVEQEASTTEAERPQQNISTSHSKYQFPELTPEETARRVAMVEESRHNRAQMWNELTPEERERSDRQFEYLYQLLEDARK